MTYKYIYRRNPEKRQGYELISRAKTPQEISDELDKLLFMEKVHPNHIVVTDSKNFTQILLGEDTEFDVGV